MSHIGQQLLWEPKCPHCEEMLDGATVAYGKQNVLPNPGDFSICIYCGNMIRFNEELEMEKLSPEYLETIKKKAPITYVKLVMASKMAKEEIIKRHEIQQMAKEKESDQTPEEENKRRGEET